MHEIFFAASIFALLVGASFGSLFFCQRFRQGVRDAETDRVVSAVGSIFTLMASLVLGLMINSSRNTFDNIDQNVHSLASQVVVLDMTLDEYGPETAQVRAGLKDYVVELIDRTWHGGASGSDPIAERMLSDLSHALRALRPATTEQQNLRRDAQAQLRELVELRWTLVERSNEILPASPFVVMLVAWLTVIFVSLGYRAPSNWVIWTTFVVSAALIAGTLYLVIDMERPFSGPITVSSAPLERSLTQLVT